MSGCCPCFAGLFGQKGGISKELRAKAVSGFEAKFGKKPTAIGVAPGRAEVLGNHTDYNEGYILAAAIDRYIVIAGCESEFNSGSTVHSENFQSETGVKFITGMPEKKVGNQAWANYVIGVVDELRKAGIRVGNFDAYITGDVPPGAGVSSSAAVELATAKLLAALFPDSVGKVEALPLIKICKAAENNFVGMGCGILDQFSSGMGKAGQLIFLDCRTCEHEYVPLKGGQFVLANTHAPHQLVDGQYMKLRTACFEAAESLKHLTGEAITHLRDVSAETFNKHSNALTPYQRKASSHIVTENDRVLKIVEALRESGDLAAMGQAMSASHGSSRDDFGNSCPELNIMFDCAQGIDGYLGSRLMGGGFGGCTINLVKDGFAESFCTELTKRYKEKTGIDPSMLAVKCGEGAYFEKV